MVISIDFEWMIDEEGYHWVSSGPTDPNEENSLVGEITSLLTGRPIRPDRIVRRGGKLRPYRPFERVDGLYRVFASLAVAPEGLMDFVHRFGPMTEDGNRNGEDALIGLSHAQSMAELLKRYSQNPGDCFSQFAGN